MGGKQLHEQRLPGAGTVVTGAWQVPVLPASAGGGRRPTSTTRINYIGGPTSLFKARLCLASHWHLPRTSGCLMKGCNDPPSASQGDGLSRD
ncbi:hypothetical protein VTK26DRAFT_273 [Humicola hyalothermophila]